MAGQYRVLCADLVNNVVREELEVHDLKYSYVLDAPGAMSGWVSLDDPKCTRDNLDPAATVMYVERGGLLVWGGPLWTVQVDTDQRRAQLGAEGFWSYFRKRTIRNKVGMTWASQGNVVTYGPVSQTSGSNFLGTGGGLPLGDFELNYQNGIDPNLYAFTWLAGQPAFMMMNAGVPANALADLPIKRVSVVSVGVAFPTRLMYLRINVGGIDYNQAPSNPGNYGLTPTAIYAHWDFNPNTGLAWTPSDIQSFASSSSFGIYTPDNVLNPFGPGDEHVFQVYLQVEWGDATTPIFINIDQLGIVEDLMNNSLAQQGSFQLVHYTEDVVPTFLSSDNGQKQVLRTHVYHPYERKNLGTAIEELAALEDGFDFSIEVSWDASGTIPQQKFVIYYPRRGSRIVELVWDNQTNSVFKFSNAVDGTKTANWVTAVGSGDANNMLITDISDPSKWAHFPLLESLLSSKDTIDAPHLVAAANAELARVSVPLENPTIETEGSVYPDFGSYQVGDEGLVRASDGWLQVDAYHRVQSIEVQVSDEGREILVPTFVSADVGF